MDKFRKKMIKYNVDSIISDSDQYHYFNSHKTFICDESVGWRPRVDVYEIRDELFIVADLPYMDPEKIEVEAGDDHLVIRGSREQMGCERKRHYYKMEIDFGPFERVVNLPVKIDLLSIRHCYRRGFYIITARKI